MIRLARIGKKKKPIYRLVISEKARDMYGKALEIIGHYNPSDKKLEVNTDRIKHWLSQGAQASKTVNNLLIENKIISGKKLSITHISKKKQAKKAQEDKKEADKKAEEAKKIEAAKEEKPAETVEKTT